ncbi:recombination protein NinB [Basfia succiniciproducens]|uniref:recombination protein NinB n=1 Tax=Basfia succiniciproducens TaxID=653940 RepID=UPI0008D64539|nr:recombination protein NinB [Basfia succiniciproducens]SEQ73989.1 NinB protein [Basfia succiniciproducens]
MTDKQTFFLRNNQIRENIINAVNNLPLPIIEKQVIKNGDYEEMVEVEKGVWAVEIKPESRNLKQNNKFHAMCQDVANQAEFMGRKLSMEQWKVLFISGHAIATNQKADVVPGLEGEFVNIRESSAKMSVSRMASLIEYVTSWGVQNGVRFNDRWWFFGR